MTRTSLIADHQNAAALRFRNFTFQEFLVNLGFNAHAAAVMYLAACREAVSYQFPQ